MKAKVTLAVVFIMIFITFLSTPAYGVQGIKVNINGANINFDIPPQLEKGRILVPMRKIFEALDAEVHWDGAAGSISAFKEGRKICLKLDSREARINDELVTLDVPARVVQGRTLVPIRFISEALGAQLHGFQMKRNSEINKSLVEHNYGLIPQGPDVKAYIDIILGNRMWRVYLTPQTEQNTMISIDELSLTLGYAYEWDKQSSTVNLIPQK